MPEDPMTATLAPAVGATNTYIEALDFEAPYLIEKLVKDHVVESADHARLLFREVKRYLVLAASDTSVAWAMYSLEVDQVWHQFVLFTRQYIDYCLSNFGSYVQHAPSTSPQVELLEPRGVSTREMFATRYEDTYGEALPDVWFDERNVTRNRRIVLDRNDELLLRDDGDGMVELLNGRGDAIFAVEAVGRPAMEFILVAKNFFVRELPGLLDDAQRVALVSVLVENRILALAS
jgi:hypothetical protein